MFANIETNVLKGEVDRLAPAIADHDPICCCRDCVRIADIKHELSKRNSGLNEEPEPLEEEQPVTQKGVAAGGSLLFNK